MRKGITMMMMMLMVMLVVTQVCEATQSSIDVNEDLPNCIECKTTCDLECRNPDSDFCYDYCLYRKCPNCIDHSLA